MKIIENFISVEDCNCFINTYKDKLERSQMVQYRIDLRRPIITERRTSTSYHIPRNDPMSMALLSKISDFLQVDINNIEPVRFAQYKKGQQLKTHHDYIPNATNQRQYSVIIYLNEVEETDGGKTVFPLCKLAITPKIGRAIWFKNCDPDGNLIMKSIHFGAEILTDTVKYILTIFVRQRPIEKNNTL